MTSATPTAPDGRAGIDSALVKRLIAAQFPQWRELPVTPVEVDGWDNRTYRLGDRMTVRLPTAEGYAEAVAKETRWLPRLAPSLPLPVPSILGAGVPTDEYPLPWSVRGWLPGETSDRGRIDDVSQFAVSVAEFIRALQHCDTTDGPTPGQHCWFRGGSPAYYDADTRRYLTRLEGHIDTARATAVWDAALASKWQSDPVWFHGDIATGNLLVEDGKLSAVIDFGTSGIGDPACDLAIAWVTFTGEAREAFRAAIDQDEGTWARGRGWALWKAMLLLCQALDTDLRRAAEQHRVIDDVLADHALFG